MSDDLDALRKQLVADPVDISRTGTYQGGYHDGVDAALAALEQVGWKHYAHGTSITKEPCESPYCAGMSIPVYRITPEPPKGT